MPIDRRHALKLLAGTAMLPAVPAFARRPAHVSLLSGADVAFLNDLQRRGCAYFFEQASPSNGQVLDRALAFNPAGTLDPRRRASIAATGFGLSALCIADRRRYMPHEHLLERVRTTLRFHHEIMPTNHGFYSHFNDIQTGQPFRHSEISPIDTALLLCGVLTARAHFHHDREIRELATGIYNRVDWPWMLNGGNTFALAWINGKFERGRWNRYCELMMMYLLALGSPTHPIPPQCWDAWTRPLIHFQNFTYISAPAPLFIHQYSHAWFDFRHKHDKYANYFQNSITATLAQRAFCISLGKPYSPDYWGITASDTEHGYRAWGGPPRHGDLDGYVVPCAAAGSLAFVPGDCLQTLRSLKQNFGAKAWGRYGFCDALHPEDNWYDPDCLGIDQGIGVLMAENLRSGFIWETFSRNPEVSVAFEKAGFHRD